MNNAQHKTIENPLKRLTMDEINAMLDEAEARFANGIYYTPDEVFREWNEHIANRNRAKKQEDKFEMAMAV